MRKRNISTTLRLNAKERKRLEKLAKEDKSNMSTVIRNLIMNTEIIPTPGELYVELAEKIHPIGVELNEIAHKANTVGYVTPEEVEHVMELEKKVIEMIKTAKIEWEK